MNDLPRWDQHRVEQAMGMLLRVGVLSAALVAGLGGAWFLMQHGSSVADYGTFRGEASRLNSIGAIVAGAIRGQSRAVVQLGLLLLIATPIARVFFSLVAFLLQRDRLYTIVTSVVLAVLLFSLIFGGR